MAFKTVEQYNEEKYGGLFRLQNDQDFAEVIFLYTPTNGPLIADTHYIKSDDYSGYVHCNGRGCPACAKGIRKQPKLFIPLYNITEGEIQFWDRSVKFEPQLHNDVFARYSNPSEFVFRIVRNGASGDINTRYTIMAIGNNKFKPYDTILSDNNIKFPDYYENICRDVDAVTLSNWLNAHNAASGTTSGELGDYVPVPRVSTNSYTASSTVPDLPDSIDSEEFDSGDIDVDNVDF